MKRSLSFYMLMMIAIICCTYAFASEDTSSNYDVIDPDEYRIFDAVLEDYHPFTVIERSTMSEKKLDEVFIEYLKKSGFQFDNYIIEDFNRKNSKAYNLDNNFSKKRNFSNEKHPRLSDGVNESLKISRAGINKEKNQALLLIRYKSNGAGKAFYMEDNLVFLYKKGDRWDVIRKILVSQIYY